MSRFWSPIVHDLEPYVPGEQPKLANLVKLNTNENPYGPSPKVLKAIEKSVNDDLRLYPDPDASKLKKAIADYHQLTVDQVFVGNGSDEVLAHVFHALFQHSSPILFPDISYSFYPVYCQLYRIDYLTVPLNTDFEVITADFTFAATVKVISLLQLKPVLVDVDSKTFNIDPALIEAAITPKTKAIIPVHLFGQIADMDAINSIAKKHNLYVVEDNAQGPGPQGHRRTQKLRSFVQEAEAAKQNHIQRQI